VHRFDAGVFLSGGLFCVHHVRELRPQLVSIGTHVTFIVFGVHETKQGWTRSRLFAKNVSAALVASGSLLFVIQRVATRKYLLKTELPAHAVFHDPLYPTASDLGGMKQKLVWPARC
jgi:hypothetical protein